MEVRLTRRQVYPIVAVRPRDIDAHRRLSVLQGDLQGAVVEVAEHEEPVRVPRAELEAERYGVVAGPARELQEAGGVEEDREAVSLHAGEGQVALWGNPRQEFKHQSEIRPQIKANLLNWLGIRHLFAGFQKLDESFYIICLRTIQRQSEVDSRYINVSKPKLSSDMKVRLFANKTPPPKNVCGIWSDYSMSSVVLALPLKSLSGCSISSCPPYWRMNPDCLSLGKRLFFFFFEIREQICFDWEWVVVRLIRGN